MKIFEPLFLICVLASLIVLGMAAVDTFRGHGRKALKSLKTLGVAAGIYMVAVITVGVRSKTKTYEAGDLRCFDDWCITVVNATRTGTGSVEVELRLSSRAKRVPQGEKGTVGYLVDSRGRRYDPIPDSRDVPFDRKLQPGESVLTKRRFQVGEDSHQLGFIYTHEGGFPIWSFIIGENEWFSGPAVVRLNAG